MSGYWIVTDGEWESEPIRDQWSADLELTRLSPGHWSEQRADGEPR